MDQHHGARGGAPIRRPRRSIESRSHPFRATGNTQRTYSTPRLSYRDGLSGRTASRDPQEQASNQDESSNPSTSNAQQSTSFWGYLRRVFSDDVPAQPQAPRPRADFAPPAGEESSSEEEEEEGPAQAPLDEEDQLMYADQYSVGDSSDENDEEEDPRLGSDYPTSAESSEYHDHGEMVAGAGAESESETDIDAEEEEEDDEDDEDDMEVIRDESYRLPRTWLDKSIRLMDEALAQSSELSKAITKSTRSLYDSQFAPGGRGYTQTATPSRRLVQLSRAGMYDSDKIVMTGDYMEVDDDPDSAYQSWVRAIRHPLAMNPSWEETISNHTNPSFSTDIDYDIDELIEKNLARTPPVFEGLLDSAEFFYKLPMLYTYATITQDEAYEERLAWSNTQALHGHEQSSWQALLVYYSRGGMYVSPTQEPRGIWRRALKQAMALQLKMCVLGLSDVVTKQNATHHHTAVTFLVDALLRTARNCYLASRLLVFAWERRRETGAKRPAEPLIALSGVTLLQPLPPEVSELLEQRTFDIGLRTPNSAVFRAFFGSLVYWAELRLALRDPASINCRYVGFHLQTSEIYLLARAHSASPGYTKEELVAMEAILTLATLMLEVALQWVHVACAQLLSENDTIKAFRRVSASIPHALAPLGSIRLHDAEFEVLSNPDVMVARDETALSQALFLGYFSVRTALTACMRDYSHEADGGSKETVTGVFLGVGLILQRLAGHLNFLLNCLAGAALYGGQKINIHSLTLPRYSLLADVMAPMLQRQSLVDFWRARDNMLEDLEITPRPGPPTQGKRVVVEMPLPSDDLPDMTPGASVNNGAGLGRMVDMAKQLQHYRETIIGEEATSSVGKRGLIRAGVGVAALRGRRRK
ncbi:tegument protein EUL47 [Equid alphaherpesvirus 1]|uniref:Tegument protein UL47 n=1 Tax=Equid alphaherpesvirus 1 TaxID=10326 RepID=A0A0A7D8C5_9ALPH|nr:tegument protein EUL47 [Equid alphaherpesvirus 1]AMB15185.1 tegument protein [Equid alphaherpesvirus 1]AMB15344.1 tegument protein [Equid alphaherpesvirus 1]AMB15423.1 tegument protein [Equid alphaherpesvirus 1]AMB15660.1 tegument protein [Equid alphaherpesvirus 1]